ncbi:MAG: hypothetical protein PHX08_15410 [Lachnospiraceae bacterium]|nr:hypothetical protein [Lachnospiraceae bacterium]
MNESWNDAALEKFIKSVEEDELLTAPRYLKSNILRESQKTSVQIAQKSTHISVKMELLLYGLKVSAAVMGAIFLLGVVNMNQNLVKPNVYVEEASKTMEEGNRNSRERVDHIAEKLNEKSNRISSKLNEFSDKLINWR